MMTTRVQVPLPKPISFTDIAYLFLSLYRFFTYVLAVLLIQVIPLDGPGEPGLQIYIIIGLVALYTLFKVFSPLLWRQRYPMVYAVLLFDIVASILLLMFTGGLDSAFLLYALTPIITASLFFQERVALMAAGLLSLPLFMAHVGLSQLNTDFSWVMTGNYLPLLIIYIICCFLIATLPYRTNLNIRQRIESSAVINERMRIRRELHDGVAQALGYLNLKTKQVRASLSSLKTDQAMAGMEDIQKVLKDTYEDIRQSIDSLSETRSLPLIATINEYAMEFSQRTGIQVIFDLPKGKSIERLSSMADLQILRMVHESLNNVRKHAEASTVWISISHDGRGIEISVRDDGKGFSLDEHWRNSSGHHGLYILKERAEGLSGTCDITSRPGRGTEVRIRVPAQKVRL